MSEGWDRVATSWRLEPVGVGGRTRAVAGAQVRVQGGEVTDERGLAREGDVVRR